MTTATAERMTDAEFKQEFLSRAALPVAEDVISVVDKYAETRKKTIASAIELGIGERGVQEIQQKAAAAFIKRWMMLKFATLDLSFTERKWWLKIERDFNNIVKVTAAYNSPTEVGGDRANVTLGEVNRFFQIEYDLEVFAFGDTQEKRASQKAGSFASTRKNGGLRSADVHVFATLPDGIGQKHVKIAQEAMGHYHLARALCYARGINIASDLGSNRYDRIQKVRVIWGPNMDVLSATAIAPRPAGDPAIVLELHGQNYLLDFYDTPDETPITNLIREFSEGNLPKG